MKPKKNPSVPNIDSPEKLRVWLNRIPKIDVPPDSESENAFHVHLEELSGPRYVFFDTKMKMFYISAVNGRCADARRTEEEICSSCMDRLRWFRRLLHQRRTSYKTAQLLFNGGQIRGIYVGIAVHLPQCRDGHEAKQVFVESLDLKERRY